MNKFKTTILALLLALPMLAQVENHVVSLVDTTSGVSIDTVQPAEPLPVIEYTLQPKTYEIADIKVTGADSYEDFVLIGFSGLAVGDKIEIKAELISVHWYDSHFAYRTITNWIYSFTDEAGNIFVWKTQKCIDEQKGDHVILKGTIKAHGEFRGIKQTELIRCKISSQA